MSEIDPGLPGPIEVPPVEEQATTEPAITPIWVRTGAIVTGGLTFMTVGLGLALDTVFKPLVSEEAGPNPAVRVIGGSLLAWSGYRIARRRLTQSESYFEDQSN